MTEIPTPGEPEAGLEHGANATFRNPAGA